jgi:hypothetical protein
MLMRDAEIGAAAARDHNAIMLDLPWRETGLEVGRYTVRAPLPEVSWRKIADEPSIIGWRYRLRRACAGLLRRLADKLDGGV